MFESVKQTDRRNGMVYAASLMVSLLAHALIISLLIMIPLVFFSSLQAEELLTILITPPTPPLPPDPPRPPQSPGAKSRDTRITTIYEAPPGIPKGFDLEAPAPEDIDPRSVIEGIGNLGPTVGPEKHIAEILTSGPIVVPEAPRRPEVKRTPIRVGSLEPSKLITRIAPIYPEIALKTRVSGDVRLEAVIDEEGNVSSVRVLSGHPFLVEAAVQAVRQWKYTPTILSGEPVSIVANVIVSFRLN